MTRLSIGLAALLAGSALQAQMPQMPAMPGGMQDAQAMMKAMEDAQAAARLPGDEALTCEQLEQQVTAAVQDPEFLAHVQAGGEAAQQDLAASQLSKAEVAAKTVATAAAATVPGASMTHMLAGRADNQAKVKKGQARQQAMMFRGQEALKFMPLLMRAQRLVELGLAKRCEWAAAAAEGMGAPGPSASSKP
jgi:hypothetical protein